MRPLLEEFRLDCYTLHRSPRICTLMSLILLLAKMNIPPISASFSLQRLKRVLLLEEKVDEERTRDAVLYAPVTARRNPVSVLNRAFSSQHPYINQSIRRHSFMGVKTPRQMVLSAQ